MPKNVSAPDDAIANLVLPVSQFTDIRNIIKNRAAASKLGTASEIYVGRVKISKVAGRDGPNRGFLKFRYKKRELMFYYDSADRLAETLGMINDEFIKEESARFDARNRDVVDIGAYVADTAICYIANGARHVYAFEPYPYFYGLGVKNIRANRLEGRITLLNAGCGSRSSKTAIDSSSINFTSVTSQKAGRRSTKQISILTLGEITKRYNLKNAVLKVDCEGCEYDILSSTDVDTLRHFSEIQIEYHYGYRNLEERLAEAGFRVARTKPIKKYNFTTSSFMVLGFITAKRL
jgi:FkbM family methyltransferase